MEPTLHKFILRHSKREQIFILFMTLVSYPFTYATLELPKIIVNQAIGGRGGFPREVLGIQFEQIAFDLVNAFNDEQRGKAVINAKAPAEVRAAGEARPPQDPPVGLPASRMTADQKAHLRKLIEVYTSAMIDQVAHAWHGGAGFAVRLINPKVHGLVTPPASTIDRQDFTKTWIDR